MSSQCARRSPSCRPFATRVFCASLLFCPRISGTVTPGIAVGGSAVAVGGTAVAVGGTGVAVGGTTVAVDGALVVVSDGKAVGYRGRY